MSKYVIVKNNVVTALQPIAVDREGYISIEVDDQIASNWRSYVYEDGKLVYSEQKQIELKQAKVRALRNSYLVQYVDPKQLVMVWGSLTDEEKANYSGYRTYLLDFTKEEEWWNKKPLTFDDWLHPKAPSLFNPTTA